MTKSRGKRHIESQPIKAALRAETRRRDVPQRRTRPRKIVLDPPPPSPPWDLGPLPTVAAARAHAQASGIFRNNPVEMDAALGWLFARFPAYGGAGSDMVAHHILLSSDAYHERWVALCSALHLFPRDP